MSPRISIRLLTAQSDQRLLTLVNEGHERAFEALVQRYRRPLLRYCRRMGLSEPRAEDVLQQALLQAWQALARGTKVRDLKPWLYRIVHNAAVNAMRASPEAHAELTEAIQATAVAVGESNLERKIAVREALTDVAALPRMQRQAIFLTAVDGQSHDEVAISLGISEGALRGLLYRARATLRSAAAALTPAPVLKWASGGSGRAGPSAERMAELTAGGGAAGVTGLVLKGAVVAVTAGAVASGAAVVDHHHLAGHPRDRGSLARGASSGAGAGPTTGGVLLTSPSAPRIRTVGDAKSGGHAEKRHGRAGNGKAERRDGHARTEPGHDTHGGSGASGPSGEDPSRAKTNAGVVEVKSDGKDTPSSGSSGDGSAGSSAPETSGGGPAQPSDGGSSGHPGGDQPVTIAAESTSGSKGDGGSGSDG